jgi:hypothetical protein
MSRRSKRRREAQAAREGSAAGAGRAAGARSAAGPGRAADARRGSRADGRSAPRPTAPTWSLGVQLAFLAAVFAVVVLVAELAGAANLGVALGVGQIAFAIAAIYLLIRR